MLGNWKHQKPQKQFIKLLNALGEPSVISNVQDGIVIWTKNDLKGVEILGNQSCFEEMILRDEAVEHNCPSKHHDYFYSYVKVGVHPSQINMLFSISGSVSYDPLKNLLSARCATLAANIATLTLCTDLLLGENGNYPEKNIYYTNISSVHKSGAYGKLINSTNDSIFLSKL